jgi:hypothetical protein
MSLQDAKFASAISEMQEMHAIELQQVRHPPILHVREQKTLHKRNCCGRGGQELKNEEKERRGWKEKERKGLEVCCGCSKFHV